MDNKCIYLSKTFENLHYTSKEHIIPASIGGIATLNKELVSDEANNLLSSLELEFVRESIIAIPRAFWGPGKRGSKSSKRATESSVCAVKGLKSSEYSLGYISLGIPYSISQLHIKDKCVKYVSSICEDNIVSDFNGLVSILKSSDLKKATTIINDSIEKNEYFVGWHKKRLYILANSMNINYTNIIELLDKIVVGDYETTSLGCSGEQIRAFQKFHFDTNVFYRVAAKIVFNFLAHRMGPEFVLSDSFDEVRNWVVSGEGETLATLVPIEKFEVLLNNLCIPSHSHLIFISKYNDIIIGTIILYRSFAVQIKICSNFKSQFTDIGMICDWVNNKEYELVEYIVLLQQDLNEFEYVER